MALSTLGEWVGSALIGKLVDKIGSYVEVKYDQYQRDDSKEKLKKLEKDLRLIRGILDCAELSKIKNSSMAYLIEDIKHAAYDAEDLLDTLEYRALAAKVEEHEKVAKPSSSINYALKRPHDDCVISFLLGGDYDELISITKRFDKIIDEMPVFLKLMELYGTTVSRGQPEDLEWRKTTSMPIESIVFGRTSEEEKLKWMLFRKDRGRHFCGQLYSVLSIVGIGGVGKTTLAQSIYNNKDISKHFDLRAWACVSDKFDLRRITIEIIESSSMKIKEDIQRIQSLDKIQRELEKGVAGKRILIVLDDVWNKISTQWEMLRKPFQFAKEGSAVIITTRDKKVAEMMGSTEILDLKGIEDDEYWKLFVQLAFDHKKPDENPKLISIGREIVKRLGGSPLAAKTVGAALRFKLNEQHWREILESKLWQVEQREDDIIPALKLSYEHLPGHLKECFVYFALFPKDHCFDKDRLIQLWMAQGFIDQSGSNKTPKDLGADYVDELLSRSFIQQVINSKDQYMVHDLLHDVAESISNGGHYRVKGIFTIKSPRKIRHVYVQARDMLAIYENVELESKEHLNKLSLFWSSFPESRSKRVKSDEHLSAIEGLQPHPNLKELEIVRYMGTKFPRWLDKVCLSNLEQLELSLCNQLATLPPLGELQFLKILNIRSLSEIEYINTDFYGEEDIAFPSLQELLFEDMAKWKRWKGAKAGQEIFPFLRKVTILGCKKFIGPLPVPDSFCSIKINASDISHVDMSLNKLIGRTFMRKFEFEVYGRGNGLITTFEEGLHSNYITGNCHWT
ncbi:hypothetical protein LUZ60_006935 [Juncus effusus]|nr:hypothetical protein LUZ60_006935 [Juncus effusus]